MDPLLKANHLIPNCCAEHTSKCMGIWSLDWSQVNSRSTRRDDRGGSLRRSRCLTKINVNSHHRSRGVVLKAVFDDDLDVLQTD